MAVRNSTKPEKLYPEFPRFPHSCGSWAKKIRGKLYYFGAWDDAKGALEKYPNIGGCLFLVEHRFELDLDARGQEFILHRGRDVD